MIYEKEGGPAQPVDFYVDGTRKVYVGMSLRDWFAGQALNGLLSNLLALTDVQRNQYPNDRLEELAATLSFEAADAMLKARER
jgi:hypothetical protein